MKGILGILIVLVAGFLFATVCYGLGILIGVFLYTAPWWMIVGGTLLSTFVVFPILGEWSTK